MSYVNFNRALSRAQIEALTNATNGKIYFATDGGIYVGGADGRAHFKSVDINTFLKADKVSGATAGHLAGLDANGNLTDSGKNASDVTTAYSHATDPYRLTTPQTSGFYKFSVTSEGHVGGVTSVVASDLTNLIGSTTYAPYNSAGYLPLSGGTMTGSITTGKNPIIFDASHDSSWNISGPLGRSHLRILNAVGASATGASSNYDVALSVKGYYGFQFACLGASNTFQARSLGSQDGDYTDWVTFYHSGNFVVGTDYVAPSALSNYLPLSGDAISSGGRIRVGSITDDTASAWNTGGLELREALYGGSSLSESVANAPGITFHWSGVVGDKFYMNRSGALMWGSNTLLHSGNFVAGTDYVAPSTLNGYLPLTGGRVTGATTYTTNSAGSTTIDKALDALIIGPGVSRTGSPGTYYPGIGFNHMLRYNGGDDYDYTTHAWIGLRLYDTPGSERSYLVFATKEGYSAERPIERMCIDPLGNVGIGTTSPGSKLHVSDGIIKVTSYSNTLSMGSQNGSWTHFETSLPFYFNPSIVVDGDVRPYTNGSRSCGDSGNRWANVYTNNTYIGTGSGSQCHQVYDTINKCLKFIFD